MPRDRFAFAVFIGCEPDDVSFFDSFFEVFDDFGVAWVDFVGDGEVVFDVNFGVFSNVSDAGEDAKIRAEVFFNGLGFGRRLDDEEVFRHIYYNSTLVKLKSNN